MKLTSIARGALTKVRNQLRRLKHEEHYNQGTWGRKTPCGTTACVAGHIAFGAGWQLVDKDSYIKNGRTESAITIAIEVLGFRPGSLFSSWPTDNWPEPFASQWKAGLRRKSRIAADYIDAILKGEAEP